MLFCRELFREIGLKDAEAARDGSALLESMLKPLLILILLLGVSTFLAVRYCEDTGMAIKFL